MKNILFLSIALLEDNRDKLTYNFISKEMVGLVGLGCRVVHFHHLVDDVVVDGVCYDGSRQVNSISRISMFIFLCRHLCNYFPLLFVSFRQAIWLSRLELAIGDVIEKHKIELVHTHFMYPMGFSAVNICKDKGVPVVSTLRGAEIYNEPSLSYGALRDPLYFKAACLGAKHISRITAPNREIQDVACGLFGLPKDRVVYLPNGVEDSLLISPPPTLRKIGGGIKLISVGRLICRKNHHFLLESMKCLVGQDVELLIVGEGPLSTELLEYTRENSLSRVSIIDELSKSELYELIKKSDFLVNPSFIEGLPNVVIEALALGKPCLVSNISAHVDVVKESWNGFYFDHTSCESLVCLVEKLINDKYLVEFVSHNCFGSVKKFKLSNKLNSYVGIYDELIGQVME